MEIKPFKKINGGGYSFKEVWDIYDEQFNLIRDIILSLGDKYHVDNVSGSDEKIITLNTPYNSNQVFVYCNGVLQWKDRDYRENSSTEIELLFDRKASDDIRIVTIKTNVIKSDLRQYLQDINSICKNAKENYDSARGLESRLVELYSSLQQTHSLYTNNRVDSLVEDLKNIKKEYEKNNTNFNTILDKSDKLFIKLSNTDVYINNKLETLDTDVDVIVKRDLKAISDDFNSRLSEHISDVNSRLQNHMDDINNKIDSLKTEISNKIKENAKKIDDYITKNDKSVKDLGKDIELLKQKSLNTIHESLSGQVDLNSITSIGIYDLNTVDFVNGIGSFMMLDGTSTNFEHGTLIVTEVNGSIVQEVITSYGFKFTRKKPVGGVFTPWDYIVRGSVLSDVVGNKSSEFGTKLNNIKRGNLNYTALVDWDKTAKMINPSYNGDTIRWVQNENSGYYKIGNSNYRYRPNGEFAVVYLKESWYKYDELVFKLHRGDYDVNIPVKAEFLKWCLESNNTNTLFGNYYCFFQLIAMKIDKTKNNVNYITTDATTMSFIGFSGDLVEIYGVKYN